MNDVVNQAEQAEAAREAAKQAAIEKIRADQAPKEKADKKAWDQVGKDAEKLRMQIAMLAGTAKSGRVRGFTAKAGLVIAQLADILDQPAIEPKSDA